MLAHLHYTMRLWRKVAIPAKGATVTAVIVYTMWLYSSKKAAFKNAMLLVSTYHASITASIDRDMPAVMAGITHADMMGSVLKILDGYSQRTSRVPTLLNSATEDILGSVETKMDADVASYLRGVERRSKDVTDSKIPAYVQETMVELDKKFWSYVDDVDSDEDVAELKTYYVGMVKALRPRVEREIRDSVASNTGKRVGLMEEFYGIAKAGVLETYRRTVETAKRVTHEMTLRNQVELLVQSDIQTRIAAALKRDITHSLFRKYAEGEVSMEDVIDGSFVVEGKIRSETESEIRFRVSNGHVSPMLLNKASDVYLKRFGSVSADKVLTDAQKRSVNALSKRLYEEVKVGLAGSVAASSFSAPAMLQLASRYLQRVMPDVKTYVVSLFIEFAGVLRRARLEGTQTCVVQFFEMRRVVDYNFFFAMCEEESFDVERTRVRFEAFYGGEIARSRSRMISLVRMPRITFLYDDSFEFLQSLSELLFFVDETLREAVDAITSEFHDLLADSIGASIDAGIEDVFEQEEADSREAVWSTFSEFEGNIKVFGVRSLVDEFTSIMFGEIGHQIDFLESRMDDLVDSFKVDTTSPYDETFFAETQQDFVSGGGGIDYDGMKRYVVEHMNRHGRSVLEEYDGLVAEFVDAKIVAVGEVMSGLAAKIGTTITEASIAEGDKQIIRALLDKKVGDIEGVILSTKTSLGVSLNTRLQQAIVRLDPVMDITTQNFFNTALREVVESFQEWAIPAFTGVYESSVSKVGEDQQVLAEEAKALFEEHVRVLIDLENKHRGHISAAVTKTLEGEAVRIVEDYNTISYAARASIVRGKLRTLSNKAVLDLERARSSAKWAADSAYTRSSMAFRARCKKLATRHVLHFNEAYSSKMSAAYAKTSDILAVVAEVMKVIEGDLREYFTESHREISRVVLAGPANDLPEINMNTICYPPGLLGLAKLTEGDLPSTMAPHLIVAPSQDAGEQIFDGEVVSEDASQLLGSSDQRAYDRVVLALSDYGSWKDNLVDDAIAKVEADMAQELRNNTCPNRPACSDGTYDCEAADMSCREGYVSFENGSGVPCCQFDPPAAGFPYEDVAKMVGVELAWCFFTDPSGIGFVAKMARGLALKMGGSVAKAGRSVGMLSRFSTRVSGRIAQANARASAKVASRTGAKFGFRLGGRMAKRLGTKLFGRVAMAIGKTLLKGLAKVAISGPVGLAMLAFDLVSLGLDLWDPNGYNNVQAAGQIKTMRDNILDQYKEALANEGITSPLVADVLYNMDPESKGDFMENLVIDWFTTKITAFLSSTEERWKSMPVSETVAEYDAEVSRLEGIMDDNLNFVQELINDSTENTFLVRSSTVMGTPRSAVGTPRDPDYDPKSETHLSVCSLNAAGVVAYNSFAVEKTRFVNDVKSNPIYRWMKVVNGYKVYEDVPSSVIVSYKSKGTTSKRIGWAFTQVDPEEEFWAQYKFVKESGRGVSGLPARSKYIEAWNEDAKQRGAAYKRSIEAMAAENLVTYVPAGEATATLEMVRNKTDTSPSWYPDYNELYAEAKDIVDQNIADLAEGERLALLSSEKAMAISAEGADKKLASASGISVAEAKRKRLEAEKVAAREPVEPDFAVFKDGFGQSSPLLSVKKECDGMGYGNHFVASKGLCEFTRAYCERYGLSYFYNEDVGTHDCQLSNVQKGFETVFGSTVTRGVKGLLGSASPGVAGPAGSPPFPVLLGASGSKTRCVGAGGVGSSLSVYDTAVKLDEVGLGAKFSVWN